MKKIYADLALDEIPRLLSCQDRNHFSPSYGSFNREFWHTRAKGFPDSIAQFGTLSLALIYAYNIPGGEKYYHNAEIKDWTIAGIKNWMKIQHRDGSYDEFYPNERGWAGPTGFLLYAILRSYEVLGSDFPNDLKDEFFETVKRSAWFLATRVESGVLANHHAMALLPIYQSYYHLKDRDPLFAEKLLVKFNERLLVFLSYCYDEGWCLEYDGVDPGYLSAVVSFLSKMQRYMTGEEKWKDRIQEVIDKAVDFSSFFFYPNGSFGGTLGSRQTIHFYAHGYELQAKNNKLAGAMANFGCRALTEGRVTPPTIQDDRYFLYRTGEFLEAYVDSGQDSDLPQLPHQKTENFDKFFPAARIFIKNTPKHYILLNLAKGGVLKVFDKDLKKLVFSDDGLVATMKSGKRMTTQWVGEEYKINNLVNNLEVTGNFHQIPYKYFNPMTYSLFTIFMILIGWNARVADFIKGVIRNLLMTKSSKSTLSFKRQFTFNNDIIKVKSHIKSESKIVFLRIGGQFAARYVPQSRYFQWEELDNKYWDIKEPDLNKLIEVTFDLTNNNVSLN
ncbi:MAG: hypothetical protein Q7K65_02625 [Candidatus Buchananbacteria bacterium]|nr:hypothetical protein [Candidatus Buchananbacteria bacterium]